MMVISVHQIECVMHTEEDHKTSSVGSLVKTSLETYY